MSGSISKSKNDPSQSLQMIERPLMTPDELKSMPKGQFIVMKTGSNPMISKLKLFFKWGINFNDTYKLTEREKEKIKYHMTDYGTSHYTKEGDIYIIQINDIVSARLYKTEEGKLRGEAPFFEGIWIIKER
jgi:type IV secretory pathway TraG/TraD family ATPase VirD4